jgi:hypothetical protein
MGLRERLAAHHAAAAGPPPIADEEQVAAGTSDSLRLLDPGLPARLEAFRSKLSPADYAILCRLVVDIDNASASRTLGVCDREADAVLRHLGYAQGWYKALEGWEAAGGVVPPA